MLWSRVKTDVTRPEDGVPARACKGRTGCAQFNDMHEICLYIEAEDETSSLLRGRVIRDLLIHLESDSDSWRILNIL